MSLTSSIARLLSKVSLDDFRIRTDFMRGPLGDLTPMIEDHDPLAQIHDDLHVVFDEENTDSLIPEGSNQLHELKRFFVA